VVAPLDGKAGFQDVMALAYAVGRQVPERHPRQLTLEFLKADRGRRIVVDIGRNEYSATIACAYAVWARVGASESAPCTWDEIAEGHVEPTAFGLRLMLERVAHVADLYQQPQSATRALARLGGPPEGPSPARRRFRS
jgi:bifunctional non-homologous end joining protein LigD